MLVCTTNEGKRREFRELLKGIEVRRVRDKGPELQAPIDVVVMNAAAYLYAKYQEPLIVEDAGLFVRALNRFPGPFSSYVLKTIGYQGILKLMEGMEDRYAEFRSVLAYAYEGGIVLFRGKVSGRISQEARGFSGFGFDPIFIPEGHERTFAEMSVEEKNTLSHRGNAVREFLRWLKEKNVRDLFIRMKFSIVSKSGINGKLLSVTRSPDDEFLAGGGGGAIESQIYLRNTKNRKIVRTLSKHTGRVRAVDRRIDGKVFVSAGDDANILVRNVEERRVYKILKAHRNRIHALRFSPDGRYLASGSDDKTVMIRDTERRMPIRRLDAHTERVRSLDRDPNGKYLVTASKDKSAIIWDVASRETVKRLLHDSDVNAVCRKPDGSMLVTGTRSGMVQIRNVEGRKPEKYTVLPYPVTSIARNPSGIIAVGLRKGILVLLKEEDLSPVHAFELGRVIYSLRRSHDRNYLAVGIEGGLMVFGPVVEEAPKEEKREEKKKPKEGKPEGPKEVSGEAAPVSLEAAQIRDIITRLDALEKTMKKLIKQMKVMNSMLKAIFEYITEMEEEQGEERSPFFFLPLLIV